MDEEKARTMYFKFLDLLYEKYGLYDHKAILVNLLPLLTYHEIELAKELGELAGYSLLRPKE